MKKKLAGLLAALMVLSMGTTVFASQSPTSQATAEQKAQQLRDSVGTVETSQDGVSVTVEKVDANVVADANEKAASYSEDAEVLGMVELKSDKDFSRGVTLTFYVAGVKKGDNIRVLHKLANGTWEVIVPYVGDGFVRATFYSLSPIAIVKYPQGVSVASTQQVSDQARDEAGANDTNTSDNSSESSATNDSNSSASSNDSSSSSSSSKSEGGKSSSSSSSKADVKVNVKVESNRPTRGGSGAATSPKTGQEFPVLPVVAVFALAGAAVVCGKKVKSL